MSEEEEQRTYLIEQAAELDRQREARAAAERQKTIDVEEDGRAELAEEEDDAWNRIVKAARQEQYDRDKTRDDERRQRNALLEEEALEWAHLIRDEEDSFQECKHREEERLAEEWRVLIEGVYSVQEQRKAESLAHEKWKHDAKRQAMTDRRRAEYVSTQTTRSAQVANQTITSDRKARAIREWESQRKEADANDIVQRLRVRREMLVGNEGARAQRLADLKAEILAEGPPPGSTGGVTGHRTRSPHRENSPSRPPGATYSRDKDNLEYDPYYHAVPPVDRDPYARDSGRIASPRSNGVSSARHNGSPRRQPPPVTSPDGQRYTPRGGIANRDEYYYDPQSVIGGGAGRAGSGGYSPRSSARSPPAGTGPEWGPSIPNWRSPHQHQQDHERRQQVSYATGSPVSPAGGHYSNGAPPTGYAARGSPSRRQPPPGGYNPNIGAAHHAQRDQYAQPPHRSSPARRGSPSTRQSRSGYAAPPTRDPYKPSTRHAPIPDPYNTYYEEPPMRQTHSPRQRGGGYASPHSRGQPYAQHPPEWVYDEYGL
eukprot:TRINITY_DN58562_c0_g1_i1.p1 TRINITY_DN58562_c0_g1~~TRINITY_DN58562_c0_g1_i1.p1  ORF type:complete len:597 (-),score=75.14 TRINITY_DN58562_c0_g1_i1:1935-3560(-)